MLRAVQVDQAALLCKPAEHQQDPRCVWISKKTGEPARNADGTPKAKTSHTLNPVPCILYDNFYSDAYTCVDGAYGLANVAATVVTLAGMTPPDYWEKSMVALK